MTVAGHQAATRGREENSPLVISLESRGSTEIDLADLISDGRLEIYPYVEDKGLVFVQFRRRKAVISAGAFIGLIPLTPNISVNVKPKLPISNLARVLDVACRSLDMFGKSSRQYLKSQLDSNSVLEFLLANLLVALRDLETNGLYKAYQAHKFRNSQPRGRIEIIPTIRSCLSRGQFHMVASEQFVQTSNLPVNRVIKEALQVALRTLRAMSEGSSQLLRDGNRAYISMPSSIGPMTRADVDLCRAAIEATSLPSARAYYYPALEVALLILSAQGVSLRELGTDVPLQSFIVNFETVFEDYLRNLLASSAPATLRIDSGNGSGKKSLFDDRREPPAQPDIVLTRLHDGSRLIAEVKYKHKVDRADINQALTYALSYRTKRAVLLHQSKDEQSSGWRHVGTIDGVCLDAYAFNLGRDDLIAEELKFTDRLFGQLA